MKKNAQEVWERNRTNPDLHATLSDINNLKLMETILKVLRKQFKDDDQMKTAGEIAGPVPEIPKPRMSGILKERGGFWRCQRLIFA